MGLNVHTCFNTVHEAHQWVRLALPNFTLTAEAYGWSLGSHGPTVMLLKGKLTLEPCISHRNRLLLFFKFYLSLKETCY